MIRDIPEDARTKLGFAIYLLQQGATLTMPLSKPMPAVAKGVSELRVRDDSGAYRVFYYLRDERGIFVFHVFEKRSQKTSEADIELGRKRLLEML